MRLAGLIAVVALLGLGALPCHWAPGAAEAMPAEQAGPLQVVRVDLGEWSLSPSRVAVAAGRPVRFIATNSGAIPHALVVEGQGVYAETASIGSAGSARLDVTFAAPGLYDLFCPIGAGQHRLLGQDGRMAVVAAGPGEPYPLTGEAAETAILIALLGPEWAARVSQGGDGATEPGATEPTTAEGAEATPGAEEGAEAAAGTAS